VEYAIMGREGRCMFEMKKLTGLLPMRYGRLPA